MAEYAGHVTTLEWDPAGGTAFVSVAQIRDLSGPSFSRNPIDASHRNTPSYWRKHIKGFKDGGEISFDLAYDGDLASHGTAAISGLLYDFNNDAATLAKWRVTFPSGRICTMDGMVTAFEVNNPLDDLLTADVTIKLSSIPAWSGS